MPTSMQEPLPLSDRRPSDEYEESPYTPHGVQMTNFVIEFTRSYQRILGRLSQQPGAQSVLFWRGSNQLLIR
jgi:hypothetical protein